MRNPEEEAPKCAECDATGVTLHDVDGDMVCEECAFKCAACGGWFKTSDAEESVDGDICNDCRDNDYVQCENCNRVVHNNNANIIGPGDTTWCERCTQRRATTCERCDGIFDPERESMRELADTGRTVCESCYDRIDAFWCSACDLDYSGRAYGGSGPGGESRCEECYESDSDEDEEDEPPPPVEEAIQGYHSHKRRWNRFGKAARKIYYGVELEAISQKDLWDFPQVAEKLEKTYGKIDDEGELKEFLFTEFDGSLRENPDDHTSPQRGFETVMHPMAPEFIRDNVPLFKNVLDLMIEGKMVSFKSIEQGISAGMHVTFTWEHLDKWTKLKFLYLVYGNRQLTTTISRRHTASLDRYAKVEAPAKPPAMILRKEGYEAKYVAVNLKNYLDKKSGSYIDLAEVRIFRGTLKLKSFLMNLEYVLACVDFAKDQRHGLKDTTAEKLLSYINSHRKLYPHIHAWLKEKGLIR